MDGLVTLKYIGRLEPAAPKVPAAELKILARKPNSKRLELTMDDLIETTIFNGRRATIIRSYIDADTSQMRDLSKPEQDRVLYSTRQFFSFYYPDIGNGEEVSYEGTRKHRGKSSHVLKYKYPSGLETTRFFSVKDHTLVSEISENGVESVSHGSQIVKGIKFPKRIEYYEGEHKLHTIVLSEVGVNEPLPGGIFKIPKPKKK